MKKILGLLIGLLVATAALAIDYGWNPVTGLEAFHGALVSQGTLPTISGTGGCGTLTAKTGGPSSGTVTIGTFATSCTLTLTFPTAAPNGWNCTFGDLTTPADAVPQATSTTTTCVTTAATMVTGDTIKYMALGF